MFGAGFCKLLCGNERKGLTAQVVREAFLGLGAWGLQVHDFLAQSVLVVGIHAGLGGRAVMWVLLPFLGADGEPQPAAEVSSGV